MYEFSRLIFKQDDGHFKILIKLITVSPTTVLIHGRNRGDSIQTYKAHIYKHIYAEWPVNDGGGTRTAITPNNDITYI